MTSAEGVDLEAWRTRLLEPFRGRPVILGFSMLAAMTPQVDELRRHGARRPLLIARGTGAGPLPGTDDAERLVLDLDPADTGTEEIRLMTALAEDPPPEVARRVAAYDPEGAAVWWLDPFAEVPEVLGRPVLGGRRPEWARLEDKTRCEEIWAAARAPRAPAHVVAADYGELVRATELVDAGAGVVWSGDSATGVNGDGEFVRWVRADDQARAAAAYFAERCDRVRVMPFLEGVPCSIHGVVLDDGVAVFRPVELVTLRRADTGGFVFGGMSTWWDPPRSDRRAMRQTARRVGTVLAERVGYRGGFNIDGVLTREGFLPTELNPRFSTAMAGVFGDLPLELVHLNAVAGRDVGMTAPALERLAVDTADRQRIAYPMCRCEHDDPMVDRVEVVEVDGEFRVAPDGAEPAGFLMIRPAVLRGALVRFVAASGSLRPGVRIAESTVRAVRFADAHWGCKFGALEGAPDLPRHRVG